MSIIVERMAWAMREKSELTDCPLTFDLCEPLARAAIEAMRDPTDAMFGSLYGVEARRQFTDMINVALKTADRIPPLRS